MESWIEQSTAAGVRAIDEFAAWADAYTQRIDTYIRELNRYFDILRGFPIPILPFPVPPAIPPVANQAWRLLAGENPEADEESLHRLGQYWADESRTSFDLAKEAATAAGSVRVAWDGDGAPLDFQSEMSQVTQALTGLAQTQADIALGVSQFRDQTIAARNAFRVQVLMLIGELAVAAISALLTGGLALLAALPTAATRRAALRVAIGQIISRIWAVRFANSLVDLARVGTPAALRRLLRAANPFDLAEAVAAREARQLQRELVRQAISNARKAGQRIAPDELADLMSREARDQITRNLGTILRGTDVTPPTTLRPARQLSESTQKAIADGLTTRQGLTTGRGVVDGIVGYGGKSAITYGGGGWALQEYLTASDIRGYGSHTYTSDPAGLLSAVAGAALGGGPLALGGTAPQMAFHGAVGGALGYAGVQVVEAATTDLTLREAWDRIVNPHPIRAGGASNLLDAVLQGAVSGGIWERFIGEYGFGEALQARQNLVDMRATPAPPPSGLSAVHIPVQVDTGTMAGTALDSLTGTTVTTVTPATTGSAVPAAIGASGTAPPPTTTSTSTSTSPATTTPSTPTSQPTSSTATPPTTATTDTGSSAPEPAPVSGSDPPAPPDSPPVADQPPGPSATGNDPGLPMPSDSAADGAPPGPPPAAPPANPDPHPPRSIEIPDIYWERLFETGGPELLEEVDAVVAEAQAHPGDPAYWKPTADGWLIQNPEAETPFALRVNGEGNVIDTARQFATETLETDAEGNVVADAALRLALVELQADSVIDIHLDAGAGDGDAPETTTIRLPNGSTVETRWVVDGSLDEGQLLIEEGSYRPTTSGLQQVEAATVRLPLTVRAGPVEEVVADARVHALQALRLLGAGLPGPIGADSVAVTSGRTLHRGGLQRGQLWEAAPRTVQVTPGPETEFPPSARGVADDLLVEALADIQSGAVRDGSSPVAALTGEPGSPLLLADFGDGTTIAFTIRTAGDLAAGTVEITPPGWRYGEAGVAQTKNALVVVSSHIPGSTPAARAEAIATTVGAGLRELRRMVPGAGDSGITYSWLDLQDLWDIRELNAAVGRTAVVKARPVPLPDGLVLEVSMAEASDQDLLGRLQDWGYRLRVLGDDGEPGMAVLAEPPVDGRHQLRPVTIRLLTDEERGALGSLAADVDAQPVSEEGAAATEPAGEAGCEALRPRRYQADAERLAVELAGLAAGAPPDVTARIRELAADARRLDEVLHQAGAALAERAETKARSADEATQQARQRGEEAAAERRRRDRFAQERASRTDGEREVGQQVAKRHRRISDRYQRAAAQADTARQRYAQLATALAPATDPATPVELQRLADAGQTAYRAYLAYQQAVAGVQPDTLGLGAAAPRLRLPDLAALTQEVNRQLSAQGVSVTPEELQRRLIPKLPAAVGADGTVLTFGTAEVRLNFVPGGRTGDADPVEVLGAPERPSEVFLGFLPQSPRGARELAATANLMHGFAGDLHNQLELLLRAAAATIDNGNPTVDAVVDAVAGRALLTASGEISWHLSAHGGGSDFALPGALAYNKGESTLFHVRGDWEVDVAGPGPGEGQPAKGRVEDAGMELWVAHPFTEPAPTSEADTVRDKQRWAALQAGEAWFPEHIATGPNGLEGVQHEVITGLGVAGESPRVRASVRNLVLEELPGRIDHMINRGIERWVYDGNTPVGRVLVKTRVTGARLVGAPSNQSVLDWIRVAFSQVTGDLTAVRRIAGTGRAGSYAQEPDPAGGPVPNAGGALTRSLATVVRKGLRADAVSIEPDVHRYLGHTQAYQLTLEHTVTVWPYDAAANRYGPKAEEVVTGDGLFQMPERRAYEIGLPVVREAVQTLQDGSRVLRDAPVPGPPPGKQATLPTWLSRLLPGSGPALVQEPVGAERLRSRLTDLLRADGWLPALDENGNPKLSTDDLERLSQLKNEREIKLISRELVEASYDQLAQDGIRINLVRHRPGPSADSEHLTLRIRLHQEWENATLIGHTDAETMIKFNIASGRLGAQTGEARTRTWGTELTGAAELEGAGSGPTAEAALRFARPSTRWSESEAGGIVNRAVRIEDPGRAAVFEMPHQLTVEHVVADGPRDLAAELVREPGAAKLFVPGSLLPDEQPSGRPPPARNGTPDTSKDGAGTPPAVLRWASILHLDGVLWDTVRKVLPHGSQPGSAASVHFGSHANVRSLTSNSGWIRNQPLRTDLGVDPRGMSPLRSHLSIAGRALRSSFVVAANLAVRGVNYTSVLYETTAGRESAREYEVGGELGLEAQHRWDRMAGESHSLHRRYGRERMGVDEGIHYVYRMPVDVTVIGEEYRVGRTTPTRDRTVTKMVVYAVPEWVALRHYAAGELPVPPAQVRDALERYAAGDLALDPQVVAEVLERYGEDLRELASARQALQAYLDPSPGGGDVDLEVIDGLLDSYRENPDQPPQASPDVAADGQAGDRRREATDLLAALSEPALDQLSLSDAQTSELAARLTTDLGASFPGARIPAVAAEQISRLVDDLVPLWQARSARLAVPLPHYLANAVGHTWIEPLQLHHHTRQKVELLDEVLHLINAVEPGAEDRTPGLYQALYGQLVDDRWDGHLESMLTPHGHPISVYVATEKNEIEHLTILLKATLSRDGVLIGRLRDAYTITQGYAIHGRIERIHTGRSWEAGSAIADDAPGPVDPAEGMAGRGHTGVGSLDSENTRLQGLATPKGVDRVERGLSILVEVTRNDAEVDRVTASARAVAQAAAATRPAGDAPAGDVPAAAPTSAGTGTPGATYVVVEVAGLAEAAVTAAMTAATAADTAATAMEVAESTWGREARRAHLAAREAATATATAAAAASTAADRIAAIQAAGMADPAVDPVTRARVAQAAAEARAAAAAASTAAQTIAGTAAAPAAAAAADAAEVATAEVGERQAAAKTRRRRAAASVLDGRLVQHLAAGVLASAPAPPASAPPAPLPDPRSFRLPHDVFIQTVEADLYPAIAKRFADLLGKPLTNEQRAQVLAQLAGLPAIAGLERQAGGQGDRIVYLPIPGAPGRYIVVTATADLSGLTTIGQPGPVEIRFEYRDQKVVGQALRRDKTLPVTRRLLVYLSGESAAEHTDVHEGNRGEVKAYLTGEAILIGARVDYQLAFAVVEQGADGQLRPVPPRRSGNRSWHPPPVTATGRAYVTVFNSETGLGAARTQMETPAGGPRSFVGRPVPPGESLDGLLDAAAGEAHARYQGIRSWVEQTFGPPGRRTIHLTARASDGTTLDPVDVTRILARDRPGDEVFITITERDGTEHTYLATPQGNLQSQLPDNGYAAARATLAPADVARANRAGVDLRSLFDATRGGARTFAEVVRERTGPDDNTVTAGQRDGTPAQTHPDLASEQHLSDVERKLRNTSFDPTVPPVSIGSTGTTYLVRLTDGTRGFYRPIGSETLHHQSIPDDGVAGREVAAYRLDEELGSGLVPPTTFWDGPLGWGSLQQAVENTTDGDPEVGSYPGPEREPMAVLDYIAGNLDRHPGAYRTGPDGELIAVEHGNTFPLSQAEPIVSGFVLDQLPGPDGGHRELSAQAVARVRAVDPHRLADRLRAAGLSQPAINGALARLGEVQGNGAITGEAWQGGYLDPSPAAPRDRIPDSDPAAPDPPATAGAGGGGHAGQPPAPPASPAGEPAEPRPPGWLPQAAMDHISPEWGNGKPNKKKDGWRWSDPAAPQANGVRIDRGDPSSPWPAQRVDHVVVRRGGKVLGRNGEPISGSVQDDAVNAHIPLTDWLQWSRWDQP